LRLLSRRYVKVLLKLLQKRSFKEELKMRSEEEIKACLFGVELLSDELDCSLDIAYRVLEWCLSVDGGKK